MVEALAHWTGWKANKRKENLPSNVLSDSSSLAAFEVFMSMKVNASSNTSMLIKVSAVPSFSPVVCYSQSRQ